MQQTYSIIIPTLNEAEHIVACLQNVRDCLPKCEIIVVDGGSEDETVLLAEAAGVIVLSSPPSRGGQCRVGAEAARGSVFIFLHVDSILSIGALDALQQEFWEGQLAVATFSILFDGPQLRYRVFEWFARFDTIFTTYGDQVIVVSKDFYNKQVSMPDMKLFEDVEFFKQARKVTKIRKLNIPVLTSVRRFKNKGFWRVNFQNTCLMLRYLLGAREKGLYKIYYTQK